MSTSAEVNYNTVLAALPLARAMFGVVIAKSQLIDLLPVVMPRIHHGLLVPGWFQNQQADHCGEVQLPCEVKRIREVYRAMHGTIVDDTLSAIEVIRTGEPIIVTDTEDEGSNLVGSPMSQLREQQITRQLETNFSLLDHYHKHGDMFNFAMVGKSRMKVLPPRHDPYRSVKNIVVDVHYSQQMQDDDGFPICTDLQITAVAHFLNWIDLQQRYFKKEVDKHLKDDACALFDTACDVANSDGLTINGMNEAANIIASFNRMAYGHRMNR